MHATSALFGPGVALCAVLGACAAGPALSGLGVPAALKPPAGQTLFLETQAKGVQIYDCAPKAAQSGSFEWVFRAPEATLFDAQGQRIGTHYAGPTWESVDGSRVVGELQARDPGADPTAIPWLLLGAKSTSGKGTFALTQAVQRLATVGGVAPSSPCTAETAGQVARVPYTATYRFFRSEGAAPGTM